jgi:glycogen operon protein
VLGLRARQSRALLGTLLLSLGVPMLLGGDEMGRTQRGNNNAYCQDNDVSWLDWGTIDKDLLAFTRALTKTRRRHPALRRRRFASGAFRDDIEWFTPAGSAMTDSDWGAGWTRSVVAYHDGTRGADRDDRGRPILDDDLLLVVNGWSEPLTFTLPDLGSPKAWQCEVNTYTGDAGKAAGPALAAGSTLVAEPRSLVLLRSARSA